MTKQVFNSRSLELYSTCELDLQRRIRIALQIIGERLLFSLPHIRHKRTEDRGCVTDEYRITITFSAGDNDENEIFKNQALQFNENENEEVESSAKTAKKYCDFIVLHSIDKHDLKQRLDELKKILDGRLFGKSRKINHTVMTQDGYREDQYRTIVTFWSDKQYQKRDQKQIFDNEALQFNPGKFSFQTHDYDSDDSMF